MMKFAVTILLAIAFLASSPCLSSAVEPVKPAKTDKCPVCGMFVAKYPDFIAGIVFKDGSYAVFDGAKDMFKYYFALGKYNPAKAQSDIALVYVTDYYSLTQFDASKAFFVIGSNVFGPMGNELIPFEKKEDAEEFLKDHAGKQMLQFNAVKNHTIRGLD